MELEVLHQQGGLPLLNPQPPPGAAAAQEPLDEFNYRAPDPRFKWKPHNSSGALKGTQFAQRTSNSQGANRFQVHSEVLGMGEISQRRDIIFKSQSRLRQGAPGHGQSSSNMELFKNSATKPYYLLNSKELDIMIYYHRKYFEEMKRALEKEKQAGLLHEDSRIIEDARSLLQRDPSKKQMAGNFFYTHVDVEKKHQEGVKEDDIRQGEVEQEENREIEEEIGQGRSLTEQSTKEHTSKV